MNTGKTQNNLIRRRFILLLAILLVVMLPLLSLKTASATSVQAERTTANFKIQINTPSGEASPIKVLAPAKASVGELVTFTVLSTGVKDLAGFQFSVIFDETGLNFARGMVEKYFSGVGVSSLQMGPINPPGRVLLGAATCPVADCSGYNYQSAVRRLGAVNGEAALATVSFTVLKPGTHHIVLDDLYLVNQEGDSLLTHRTAAPPPSIKRMDLTRNQIINDADAEEISVTWVDLQERGTCMSQAFVSYDLNGNKCLDVGDVQAVLSKWGEALSVDSEPIIPQDVNFDMESVNAPTAELVVSSDGDESDLVPGDGDCLTSAGTCTLRAAVQEANLSKVPANISFEILPGGICPGIVTIAPNSTPDTEITIDNKDGQSITIDGYSQCGASPNSGNVTGNAVIKIQILGNATEGVSGLVVRSGSNTIRGLAIYNWDSNIYLFGSRASNNKIEGNFLGTDAAQEWKEKFTLFDSDSLRVGWNATNNIFGGVNPAQRNIISGADQDGLGLQGYGVHDNKIFNNYIGVKQDGLTPLRNQSDGVDVAEGVYNNFIGGLNPGERNVLSGNGGDGIEISHNLETTGNKVLGNFIGLGADGSTIVQNRKKGVTIEDEPNETLVERNVIVGNAGVGVRIYTANYNIVRNNYIGLLPPGLGFGDVVPLPTDAIIGSLLPRPNGTDVDIDKGMSGVYLTGGSSSNQISTNVIGFHPEYGIYVDANPGYLPYGTCTPYFNTFSKNWIYENSSVGIRLKSGVDCGQEDYPNENIQPPTLTEATTTQVKGKSCAGCNIEVFLTDEYVDTSGEGKFFRGEGWADGSGNFTINLYQTVAVGEHMTATTTDSSGNTSQFARNIEVLSEGVPVTPPVPTTTVPPTATPATPSPTTAIPTTSVPGTPSPTNKPTEVPGYNQTLYLPFISDRNP